LKKNLLYVLVFCFIASLTFASFSQVIQSTFADEQSLEEKKQLALKFIEKVVGINLSNYVLDISESFAGKTLMFSIELSGGEENITIYVFFERGMILRLDYKPRPPPSWLWTEKPTDNICSVRELLERYELSFNTPYTQILQLLDQALPNQNQTISNGDFTLNITDNGRKFIWNYIVNGIIVFNALSIEVSEDGHLTYLGNRWGIYNVGSTEINVSEEQAINIGLPYAQSYAEEHGRTIESITAVLFYDRDLECIRGDEYVIYPRWNVEIHFEPLDSWTGSGIYGYAVSLWADTGEVYCASSMGAWSGGSEQPSYLPLFIIVAVTLTPALIGFTLAYRRRSKKPKVE
jgi:hypothetical protein